MEASIANQNSDFEGAFTFMCNLVHNRTTLFKSKNYSLDVRQYMCDLNNICGYFLSFVTKPDQPPPDLPLLLNYINRNQHRLYLAQNCPYATMIQFICQHHTSLCASYSTRTCTANESLAENRRNNRGCQVPHPRLPANPRDFPAGCFPSIGYPNQPFPNRQYTAHVPAANPNPSWISMGIGSQPDFNMFYNPNHVNRYQMPYTNGPNNSNAHLCNPNFGHAAMNYTPGVGRTNWTGPFAYNPPYEIRNGPCDAVSVLTSSTYFNTPSTNGTTPPGEDQHGNRVNGAIQNRVPPQGLVQQQAPNAAGQGSIAVSPIPCTAHQREAPNVPVIGTTQESFAYQGVNQQLTPNVRRRGTTHDSHTADRNIDEYHSPGANGASPPHRNQPHDPSGDPVVGLTTPPAESNGNTTNPNVASGLPTPPPRNSGTEVETTFTFTNQTRNAPTFQQLPGTHHWIQIPPNLEITISKNAFDPYLLRLFGPLGSTRPGGWRKHRFVRQCKGGLFSPCTFKVLLHNMRGNTW